MRVLFSFTGGRGHAEPLAPLARAAASAGHEVAFAGRRAVVGELEFPTFVVGLDVVPKRAPLLAYDLEREERILREGFAGRLARTQAADVLELCGTYRPDVLVCDEGDFGGMVAAERFGVPGVPVLVTAAGSFIRRELVAEPVAELRSAHGLDPELREPDLTLAPIPPSFRDPAFPLPAGAVCIRLGEAPATARRGVPPIVYFTLGTVFPLEAGDLFERVLGGLRELPVEAIVTVGTQLDPAELGPQRPGIRVERFVPQSDVLPRSSAVVCHAGSGTVIGALAHGLPLVNIPLGADQPPNAARCELLGAGRTLDPLAATPDDVREAVSAVLTDPAYRAAAERIRDEIAALPGPEHAVALLERLVLE